MFPQIPNILYMISPYLRCLQSRARGRSSCGLAWMLLEIMRCAEIRFGEEYWQKE